MAGTGTCAAVPAGAAAVEINLVAVSPTGNGNLRVSANGVVPGGGVVNFTTGVTNSNALPVETNNNQIDVHVNNGPAHIRGVMLGYYTTDLQTQVNTLQTQVNDLQTLLAGVSRTTVDGYDTLRLTTVNLQLVDGTNSTYSNQNGYGNLIIGYNVNNSNTRVGSHNLIVGDSHSYSRNGTVIFGFGNATYATASSITGGQNNTTTGDGSSVSGGNANTASSSFSSVSGGVNNTASAFFSSVTGGRSNVASGLYSSVSGGSTRSSTSDDDWRAGSLFEDF